MQANFTGRRLSAPALKASLLAEPAGVPTKLGGRVQALSGLVHIGTNESTAWALVVPCRGQVRPRIQAKLDEFRVLAEIIKLCAPLSRIQAKLDEFRVLAEIIKLCAPLARFQRTTPVNGRCSVQFRTF